MIRRWTMALAAAMALAAGTASAGGWATVTLDEVPAEARAGETLELGFVVRQHGRTPVDIHTWEGRMPVLTATHVESGETISAEARKHGAEGHYTVSVAFPRPGAWAWQIAPEPFAPTQFEALSVTAAAPAGRTGAWGAPQPFLVAGGVALLLAAAALALASRRSPGAVARPAQ